MVTVTLQVYKYFSSLNFFLRFFRNLGEDEFYFGKTAWNCQADRGDRTISLGLHDRNTENTGLSMKSNSLVPTPRQANDNGSLKISDIGLMKLFRSQC